MTSSTIRDLFLDLGRAPGFQALLRRLATGDSAVSLSGLTPTAKGIYLSLLARETQRPLMVVVDGNKQAELILEVVEAMCDLLGGLNAAPQMLPALDVMPSQRLSPHSEIAEQRAIGLWRLSSGMVPLTVAPIMSALLRTDRPEFYRQLAVTLKKGEEIPLDELVRHLQSIGYEQREPVEMPGEYSVRGGILDAFPVEAEQPVRIDLFGDLVEEIRRFDPNTQRSVLKIDEVTLLPLLEQPRSRQLLAQLHEIAGANPDYPSGEPFPGWEFLVPLAQPKEGSVFELGPKPLVVLDEPELIQAAAERFWKRLSEPERPNPCPPEKIYFPYDEWRVRFDALQKVEIRELDLTGTSEAAGTVISSRPTVAFHGNMQAAVGEGRSLVQHGGQVAYFATSAGELERLADIFQEYSIPFQLGIDPGEHAPGFLADRGLARASGVSTYLLKGSIRRGVSLPESNLAIFGCEDLFDSSDLVAQPKIGKSQLAAFQADIADLKPGDFVVHVTHGVGQFLGIRTLDSGDFMLLEYAGENKLYVPLTRLDLVQKYRGAGEAKPTIDRLGGATWSRTKSRVKAKMRDMADELLKLYAQRKMAEGFSFSPDSNWQREFEDAFEYAATRDQLTAVQQIKRDMESETPMDRLLCGDVGFGKTEVAMRAAFKALGDGKQVAVLAPTTVLSLQHFETFKRRFASFPVRIEMLSRLRGPKEMKQTLEDIADGKVDIAVGTHRVLSQDVHFKDLGLLIVDEEQRFGVRHKERIKQMKRNIDVLTMSATPIPRTLHMSLLGLRDMSVIETPPKDRIAVHTVVAHFNPDVIKSAIEQELSRNGQVYFVHNRIDTIFMRAAMIQSLIPDLRIGVGHGQMGEAELEKVLLGFMKHDFDVFVCTTIVENGLDIPMANTIIIENAERYGLSELYQLRGRVGRSNRRAYAYLMVPEDAELTEIARKRLAALKEFGDLGAGFKIAALDLELRGAGNLLGGEQHGHIGSIGFDTYVRLLEETVHELRGEEVPLEIHSTLNLGLDLRIPQEYIGDEAQRLRAYKRIADVRDEEQATRTLEELEDRYGKAPEIVRTLMRFAVVKSIAQRLGVEAVDRRSGFLNIKFHPEAKIDPNGLMRLVSNTEGAQFTPAGVLRLPVERLTDPRPLLDYLGTALSEMG